MSSQNSLRLSHVRHFLRTTQLDINKDDTNAAQWGRESSVREVAEWGRLLEVAEWGRLLER